MVRWPLAPLVFTLCVFASGCSPAFWEGYAAAVAQQAPAPTMPAELLIFGGANHDVFLGCLTCSKYDAGSVLNDYGSYGSRYSATSIVNQYSQYGSRYSSESACNPYTSSAPVVVDRAGNYYGELTVNRYNAKRTQIGAALQWLAIVCNPD